MIFTDHIDGGKILNALQKIQHYANFKRDLCFEDTKFTFPTENFATALKNKGRDGCWDWWFANVNWVGDSKSLMNDVIVME